MVIYLKTNNLINLNSKLYLRPKHQIKLLLVILGIHTISIGSINYDNNSKKYLGAVSISWVVFLDNPKHIMIANEKHEISVEFKYFAIILLYLFLSLLYPHLWVSVASLDTKKLV